MGIHLEALTNATWLKPTCYDVIILGNGGKKNGNEIKHRRITRKVATITWFHLFKAMIDSGDLANMSGSAVKAYLVIKSECDFKEGGAEPTYKDIQAKAGLQSQALSTALKELETMGYVQKVTKGRKSAYQVVEKFHIDDTIVTFNYAPAQVKSATKELNDFLITRHTQGSFQFIKIEKVENLTVININIDSNVSEEALALVGEMRAGKLTPMEVVDKLRKKDAT